MAIKFITIGSMKNVFGYDDSVTSNAANFPGPVKGIAGTDSDHLAINSTVTAKGVPTGGIPGQLLHKASATDYDTIWESFNWRKNSPDGALWELGVDNSEPGRRSSSSG